MNSIISVNFLTDCTNSVNSALCFCRIFTQVLPKHTVGFISADVIILVDEQKDTHVAACDSLFTFQRHVCILCWPQSV